LREVQIKGILVQVTGETFQERTILLRLYEYSIISHSKEFLLGYSYILATKNLVIFKRYSFTHTLLGTSLFARPRSCGDTTLR
jgi:hypothetical protein